MRRPSVDLQRNIKQLQQLIDENFWFLFYLFLYNSDRAQSRTEKDRNVYCNIIVSLSRLLSEKMIHSFIIIILCENENTIDDHET